MTCADVADLIDPIAAGDLTPDAAVSAHLAACPSCARTLDAARRIETLLRARLVPSAPSQFTQRPSRDLAARADRRRDLQHRDGGRRAARRGGCLDRDSADGAVVPDDRRDERLQRGNAHDGTEGGALASALCRRHRSHRRRARCVVVGVGFGCVMIFIARGGKTSPQMGRRKTAAPPGAPAFLSG